jgi:hypothetical protein
MKQPGREADHSPPSSAEVKNVWSYEGRLKSLWTGGNAPLLLRGRQRLMPSCSCGGNVVVA